MRQNNPLLYIFVGMIDDSLDFVRETQSKRVDVKGVGYLSIPGAYEKDRLLAEIRNIQSRFLTTVYVASGEIKIVYVVNADSPHTVELTEIMRDTDGYLAYLYPGGILTDIILMLDDVHNLSAATNRGEIIDRIAGMRSDTCMLYMISNLNSHKLYESDAHRNMLYGIALLGLMKDYVSLQSTEQLYRWYNERYFKEDCYRAGGHFMTFGYLSISRPLKLIKKLMLIELLICREKQSIEECEFIWEAQKISDVIKFWRKENIYGLCMDAAVNLDGLGNYTNKKALEILFGDRLEHFFHSNFQAVQTTSGDVKVRKFLRDCARKPTQGFYYIHAVTAPDGALRAYLTNLLDHAKNKLESIDSQAEKWQNESCNTPKQRWLSSNRVPDYIYELALQFLEPRFERLQPEAEIKRLTEAIEYVDACHREFARKHRQLAELVSHYKEEAEHLLKSDEVFIDCSSLDSYYIAKLREVVENDPEFDAIYSRLWRSIDNKTLDLYIAELESYIENTIMRRNDFDRGIVDDLTGAWGVGGGKVYESIWRHIIGSRYFNIMLKSGCKNLHSEINVFMDTASQLARWAGVKEKINFFYEENSNRIDVLYHGGAFSSSDLYYDALYRGEGL